MSLDLAPLRERRRTPLTTYRLQLHGGFGFRDAAGLTDYLEELGVTDLYTSPILRARPGSMHGYDITDHRALNPELGSEADYENLVEALRSRRLGHLLDFVPNHMSADATANPWWRDVLENGPASPYADYFDIDWTPEKADLRGKVLLPVLGDQYGAVLERGELALSYEAGRFSIRCGGGSLPVDPQQAPRILERGVDALKMELKDDPLLAEFLSVLTQLGNLPGRADLADGRPDERRREAEVARGRLDRLVTGSARLARHVSEAVSWMNGRPGDAGSFDALHALLEEQAYRLAYWKTASDEINYRRFFDVNDLVGIRMERDDVFEATHGLVLDLLATDKVTGLRIDHPDGLYDPSRYFERLQSAFLRAWLRRRLRPDGDLTPEERAEVDEWRAGEIRRDFKGLGARPLYLAAEKILSPGEALDPHWRVDGTSGYDFLNDVNRAFVDPRGASALRGVYERFTDQRASLETVIYAGKKAIMDSSMASELNALAGLLARVAERDRRVRDFTRQSLRRVLREIVACFPVYRTYVTAARATAYDRDVIRQAVDRARRRNPAEEPTIFEFIRSLMMPRRDDRAPEEARRRKLRFAMKLQQYTGPVQAKGIEDTAFYRCHVLISVNEVGSDPARLAGTVRQFHESNLRRADEWPRSMLATATHDTKRGEDARARIDVLSEVADEWETAARSWAAINRGAKSAEAGAPAPDADDEYLFYQALLGAWDFAREDRESVESLRGRLQAFLLKAGREAKLKSSWIAPNAEYERATAEFVTRAFANAAFLESFRPFARRVAALGALSSLSRTVLKIASPGVSDFFQGTELWDLSLVDPDNRRPVDFADRRAKLTELEPLLSGRGDRPAGARRLLESWEDGRIKLYVTARALRIRRERAALFRDGAYVPLAVVGGAADRFIAFERVLGSERAVAVVPRLSARPLWTDGLRAAATLAAGASLELNGARPLGLTDAFTGAVLPEDGSLAEALAALPFALFTSVVSPS